MDRPRGGGKSAERLFKRRLVARCPDLEPVYGTHYNDVPLHAYVREQLVADPDASLHVDVERLGDAAYEGHEIGSRVISKRRLVQFSKPHLEGFGTEDFEAFLAVEAGHHVNDLRRAHARPQYRRYRDAALGVKTVRIGTEKGTDLHRFAFRLDFFS